MGQLDIDFSKIGSRAIVRLERRLIPLVRHRINVKLRDIHQSLLAEYGFEKRNKVDELIGFCRNQLLKKINDKTLRAMIEQDVKSSLGYLSLSVSTSNATVSSAFTGKVIGWGIPIVPSVRDYLGLPSDAHPVGTRD